MNKFGVAKAIGQVNGKTVEFDVPMWAEFRFEIGDRNPLFRVTSPVRGENGRRYNGEFRFIVTHVGSGYRFTDFKADLLAKARYNLKRNNYGRAGAMAVKKTIDEVGIVRILRALEGFPDE